MAVQPAESSRWSGQSQAEHHDDLRIMLNRGIWLDRGPRGGVQGEWRAYLCTMGMTNAPVLPEPVIAMPTTSTPCRMRGIVFRWIGVGSWKPLRLIALRIGMDKPIFSALPLYL